MEHSLEIQICSYSIHLYISPVFNTPKEFYECLMYFESTQRNTLSNFDTLIYLWFIIILAGFQYLLQNRK